MRALESNILPFVDTEQFPYSIILDFTSSVLKIVVHKDLLSVLRLSGMPWERNSDFQVLSNSLSQFNTLITQVLTTAKGFAYFIPNATSLQCAAHTHYCCLVKERN